MSITFHLPGASPRFLICDLGCMDYAAACSLQKRLQQDVIAWRNGPQGGSCGTLGYLLLVEHDPPVITISRRKSARQHLIASPQMLRTAGVEVAETDRGGDITYHGPGQLVVYPILDLNRLGLRLHGYMRFLEEVVIETLAQFGICGRHDPSATGVWIVPRDVVSPQLSGRKAADAQSMPAAKICAMGVRVSRWVTMHGLALNVTTNLDHFNLIIPCGLTGRTVTSMQRELGEVCPAMHEVKRAMVNRFAKVAEDQLSSYRA